ncbi:MAG TPA: adenosylcobinamide-phosphate synthase CbiB [Methyloceanibacter sp.]|nr:adenosylcobinamide-phosphate synthase CbiB [Methyloceanibacter sp.]
MSLSFNFATVICAALIEAGFGYPASLLDRIKHPVMWIGALLERLERHLNDPSLPEAERRRNGWVSLALLLAATALPAIILQYAVLQLPAPLALVILACFGSTLIAQRSLYEHVAAVADALDEGGIEAGRDAVARIVGRDTSALDEAGVARSAMESLAENFSDGVVAPVLWGAVLGLPGMVGYKAINTADSMIGHRTPRHEAFGFAAAKVDDAVNLPASRLAAFFLALATLFHDDADFHRAVETVRRDADTHRSPNAGWPEAAMAGALGLKLSGPRVYHGALTDDEWIGEGREEANSADIRRALGLYKTACTVQIVALGLLAVFIALL